MKKYNVFIFVLSVIFIIAISIKILSHHYSPKANLPHEDKIAYETIGETAKELKRLYELSPVGEGLSGYPKLNYLALSLYAPYSLEKNKIRELIVESSKVFIKQIESNEELVRELKNNKTDIQNIQLTIFFHKDKYFHSVYHPTISVVSLSEGYIYYKTNFQDEYRFKSIEEETYEEAVAILERQRKQAMQSD